MIPKGSKDGVSFPELTVLAKNIDDVEIISSSNNKPSGSKKSTNNNSAGNNGTGSKGAIKKTSATTTFNPEAKQSPHATPSVYANKTHTFPTGNARHTLPREEFDFVANLARFDKASEFKKIQAEDSVPKGDRLVAINSPQRKLGIHENVLDSTTVKKNKPTNTSVPNPTAVNNNVDEIMEKFKHLTVPSVKTKSSPILVEEGSSDDSEVETKPIQNNSHNESQTPVIPMVSSKLFDSIGISENESYRTISAINFAHHLLAELDPSKPVVLLLGVGEISAILMETFYHLTSNSRRSGEVHAIFAAGGKSSDGKRIELTSSVKAARKKLLSTEKVKFTTALNEIVKLNDVIVFDALGHDGEMTPNAVKGLTEWMKKLLTNSRSDTKIIYGIESSILRTISSISSNQNVALVTFGIARDTLVPSLPVSKSLLYVDAGINDKIYSESLKFDQNAEIFSESFVTEIEY